MKVFKTDRCDSVVIHCCIIKFICRQSSQIFVACRHFKSLVGQLRDRSLRALTFARSILTDVEMCALYRIKTSQARALLYQLYLTSHSLVRSSSTVSIYFLFIDLLFFPLFFQIIVHSRGMQVPVLSVILAHRCH